MQEAYALCCIASIYAVLLRVRGYSLHNPADFRIKFPLFEGKDIYVYTEGSWKNLVERMDAVYSKGGGSAVVRRPGDAGVLGGPVAE